MCQVLGMKTKNCINETFITQVFFIKITFSFQIYKTLLPVKNIQDFVNIEMSATSLFPSTFSAPNPDIEDNLGRKLTDKLCVDVSFSNSSRKTMYF